MAPANPPAECAAWAGGMLRGSSMVLLHQDALWRVFDRWLSELAEETFVELLPLLRRAFADFTPAQRRQMAEKIKHPAAAQVSAGPPAAAAANQEINLARARQALPVLAQILGVPHDDQQ